MEMKTLHLTIEKNIEPLRVQLGVPAAKAVPDVLDQMLFGSIKEQDGSKLASFEQTNWKTFAVLDAAKVPNLVEMLEASGLEHSCLFKGDAYDELKDVAPWLVELKLENSFTRRVFVKSDEPWHLWDSEPGIFIRSQSTLDELRSHFRKFTRVNDDAGKWFYFRFWEGSQIPRLISDPAFEPVLVKLCGDHIIIWRHLDTAYCLSVTEL